MDKSCVVLFSLLSRNMSDGCMLTSRCHQAEIVQKVMEENDNQIIREDIFLAVLLPPGSMSCPGQPS